MNSYEFSYISMQTVINIAYGLSCGLLIGYLVGRRDNKKNDNNDKS